MNLPTLVCFDIETTGLKSDYHEVIQLAAVAYDSRTMEPIPREEGGVFDSLMKPLHEDRIQQQAMDTHKIPLADLRQAPHPKAVWGSFLKYLKQFNPKGLKTTAPIACGKRIGKFDLPFIYELSKLYSPKKDKQVLFNSQRIFDLEDLLVHWFWHDPEITSIAMDKIRERFDMSKDKAHQALKDAQQTGYMITYLFKLTKDLQRKETTSGEPLLNFKKAFRGI